MLYPMFTLVLLTFIIGIMALKARFNSIKTEQFNPAYYLLMKEDIAGIIPERVIVTTRSVNNMFEVPVLFYAAAIMATSLELESTLTLITAWVFVISRIIHAWIHLTYNDVMHRMRVFWFGLLTVLALWVELVVLSL